MKLLRVVLMAAGTFVAGRSLRLTHGGQRPLPNKALRALPGAPKGGKRSKSFLARRLPNRTHSVGLRFGGDEGTKRRRRPPGAFRLPGTRSGFSTRRSLRGGAKRRRPSQCGEGACTPIRSVAEYWKGGARLRGSAQRQGDKAPDERPRRDPDGCVYVYLLSGSSE